MQEQADQSERTLANLPMPELLDVLAHYFQNQLDDRRAKLRVGQLAFQLKTAAQSDTNVEIEVWEPMGEAEVSFLDQTYNVVRKSEAAHVSRVLRHLEKLLQAHVELKSQHHVEPEVTNPIEQFKQFDYGDTYKGFICPNPFMYGELRQDGGIAACCYLPFQLGNLEEQSLEEVWSSATVKELRKSILNGDYSYCDRSKCGGMQKVQEETKKSTPLYQAPYELLSDEELAERNLDWIKQGEELIVPQIVSLEDDPSCNLSCPSCRTGKIALGKKKSLDLVPNQDKLLAYSEYIDEIWICGAGDPFASVPYRKMLKEFDPEVSPKLNFRLDTNGVLLTPRTWATLLEKAQNNISMIAVSIDGTTPEVYDVTRRDGNFDVLMKNLEFIAEVPQRQTGMDFIIRMIVQEQNFHQMLEFVELGRRLKVDRIVFSGISNWGTFTDEEFAGHQIQVESHPRFHELREILKDPVFYDEDIDLGNLTNLFEKVQEDLTKQKSAQEARPVQYQSMGGLQIESVNAPTQSAQEDAKLAKSIAFYLPQFHQIPENDKWWGKGFTEWTNTAKAEKYFRHQYQPHVPSDLGFYDLRLPEARKAQAELAKAYGIDAFCYWHYWFGYGRRLLERPLDEVVKLGEPDFPFCLGWANQTWSGVWHGAPNKILMEQFYPGLDDYKSHFYTMLSAFRDPRYFQHQGKLLFLIYDPAGLPDSKEFVEYWQQLAKSEGLPGFHFVAHGNRDHRPFGCDSAVDNAPFINFEAASADVEFFDSQRSPKVRRYQDFVEFMKTRPLGFSEHPLVVPNWDNTPRSGERGYCLHGSTPELFEEHMRDAVEKVQVRPKGDRLVFIKAWNEWAEGNHLEPDIKYGHQYLEAVKRSLWRR